MDMLWLVPVSFLACLVLFLGAALRFSVLVNVGGAAIVLIVIFFAVVAANARDPSGRWANSELKPWFDGLRSGRGPCCSDADGSALSDAQRKAEDVRGGVLRFRGRDGIRRRSHISRE